ncbi:MAG: anti-sigma factor family protein [Geminicoccaceae bacterium]
MTTQIHSIDEDDFQAFVDGQLSPEVCRTVMTYLAAHPEESERMSDYHKLSEGLQQQFNEVLYEPLPKRLRVDTYRKNRSLLERVRSCFDIDARTFAPKFAAIAVLMMASAGAGWWSNASYMGTRQETPAMNFARQAASAHMLYAPELRYPVEFGADQQDSLLLWLTERLGEQVRAPSLQDIGFVLVGGRLLPAAEQAAAQLMYENPDSSRITLYIRERWNAPMQGAKEGSVSYFGEGSQSMVYWVEGPFAYALIGELDREQLFATAKTIRQQVESPAVAPTVDQTADAEKDAT